MIRNFLRVGKPTQGFGFLQARQEHVRIRRELIQQSNGFRRAVPQLASEIRVEHDSDLVSLCALYKVARRPGSGFRNRREYAREVHCPYIRQVKGIHVLFAEEGSRGNLPEVVYLMLARLGFALHHRTGMMSRISYDKVVGYSVCLHEAANAHCPWIISEPRHESRADSQPGKSHGNVHFCAGNACPEMRYISKSALLLGKKQFHRLTDQKYLIHN